MIICYAGRPKILHETVLGFLQQTVQPDSIMLSLCERSSALPQTDDVGSQYSHLNAVSFGRPGRKR